MADIRKFMDLVELGPAGDHPDRDQEGRVLHPDVAFSQPTDTKIVAQLASYNSGKYTRLAQQVQRMERLESRVKQLKEETKQGARELVADLFSATDAVLTRVVQTKSFIFQLTKDPKPTETFQYAKILKELEADLTPDLIKKLEFLKTKYSGTSQKPPALSIDRRSDADAGVGESMMEGPVGEKLGGLFAKLKSLIMQWASGFDNKLNHLKAMAAMGESIDNLQTPTIEAADIPVEEGFFKKAFAGEKDDDEEVEDEKKDEVEESAGLSLEEMLALEMQGVGMSDELAAKKIAQKIQGTPNLTPVAIKQYVTKYLGMVGKHPTDVDFLAALVQGELEHSGMMEAPMALPGSDTVYSGSRQGKVVGTVPNKPETTILELPDGNRIAVPTDSITTEKPGLMKRAFSSLVGEEEKIEEMPKLSDMSSGYMKSDRAINATYMGRGGEPVELSDGTKYVATGHVKSAQLRPGDVVLTTYNSTNQGADMVEFLGFVDGHGDTPTWKTLKDVASHFKVKTLRELEEKANVHMVVKDIDSGESGGWFYLFHGRWCRGSGAEPLTFDKMRRVEGDDSNFNEALDEAAGDDQEHAICDSILAALSTAQRMLTRGVDTMYSPEAKQTIDMIANSMRDDLKKGDLKAFLRSYSYFQGKYVDTTDELYLQMFKAATGMPETPQGPTWDDFADVTGINDWYAAGNTSESLEEWDHVGRDFKNAMDAPKKMGSGAAFGGEPEAAFSDANVISKWETPSGRFVYVVGTESNAKCVDDKGKSVNLPGKPAMARSVEAALKYVHCKQTDDTMSLEPTESVVGEDVYYPEEPKPRTPEDLQADLRSNQWILRLVDDPEEINVQRNMEVCWGNDMGGLEPEEFQQIADEFMLQLRDLGLNYDIKYRFKSGFVLAPALDEAAPVDADSDEESQGLTEYQDHSDMFPIPSTLTDEELMAQKQWIDSMQMHDLDLNTDMGRAFMEYSGEVNAECSARGMR